MSGLVHVTIAPGRWLAPGAAESYERMRDDGCPAGITSAGRTRAEQAELWRRQGAQGLAAPPDAPTAYHQQGIALDVPPAAEAWIREHGGEHGWSFPLPHEHWHCVYDPNHDQYNHPTTPQEDDDMIGIILWGYRSVIGREPGPQEVVDRLHDFRTATPEQAATWFLDSRAEPATIMKAYRDILDRVPGDDGMAAWLGKTVREVLAGVAGSPEALARRA